MGHGKNGRGKRAVLIAGPTASGKSALALALAEKLGGTIVNADSMQVYRDLRVITARPSAADEARAPHRLYGHVDAAEVYSVGRFCRDVADAIAQAAQAGQIPILVGGTGLYFIALTQGLAEIPAIPADIRTGLRARLESEGVEALHRELAARDPEAAARLKPRDRSRILRALEVFEATGRTLNEWHRDGMKPLLDPDSVLKFVVDVPREELARRIDARFDAMLAAGALEEARALAARNLLPTLPAMKALGVLRLIRHLRGEISLDEAATQAKGDTRRYVKRQETWFRNRMKDWKRSGAEDALRSIERDLGSAR